mmetsp:Transcript_45512/g.145126  ORF Transcript_45512/g.145126 Transcript_45512/m.145126 type:complete len:260 (+) Transcript_45512:918-1697(+)
MLPAPLARGRRGAALPGGHLTGWATRGVTLCSLGAGGCGGRAADQRLVRLRGGQPQRAVARRLQAPPRRPGRLEPVPLLPGPRRGHTGRVAGDAQHLAGASWQLPSALHVLVPGRRLPGRRREEPQPFRGAARQPDCGPAVCGQPPHRHSPGAGVGGRPWRRAGHQRPRGLRRGQHRAAAARRRHPQLRRRRRLPAGPVDAERGRVHCGRRAGMPRGVPGQLHRLLHDSGKGLQTVGRGGLLLTPLFSSSGPADLRPDL